MKKLLPIACVIALATSLLVAQDPAKEDAGAPDLGKRVETLEKELAATRLELTETRALLDNTVGYLQAQAAGSKKLLETLDASEQAGFTAGINPHSREVLLGGFREWWGAKTVGVPVRKVVPEPEEKAKPGRRPRPPVRRRDGDG